MSSENVRPKQARKDPSTVEVIYKSPRGLVPKAASVDSGKQPSIVIRTPVKAKTLPPTRVPLRK